VGLPLHRLVRRVDTLQLGSGAAVASFGSSCGHAPTRQWGCRCIVWFVVWTRSNSAVGLPLQGAVPDVRRHLAHPRARGEKKGNASNTVTVFLHVHKSGGTTVRSSPHTLSLLRLACHGHAAHQGLLPLCCALKAEGITCGAAVSFGRRAAVRAYVTLPTRP
jgi:hypothetical protein